MNGTRRTLLLGMAALAAACNPGLGPQITPKDYAHTFTRRDLKAVRELSSPSFRAAVWDRISPEEFQPIARLMGHGRHMNVVDTRFDGDRAFIQLRTENRDQYRLHAMRVGNQWLIDDILKELEPAVFESKRRQAEAVLALRDFRTGLKRQDAARVADASSTAFASEVWARLTSAQWSRLAGKLDAIADDLEAEAGDVRRAADGSLSAPVAGYVIYFARERDRLVVDDVHLPKGPPTMRVRLRNEAGR